VTVLQVQFTPLEAAELHQLLERVGSAPFSPEQLRLITNAKEELATKLRKHGGRFDGLSRVWRFPPT
jgi:hypothetical protein